MLRASRLEAIGGFVDYFHIIEHAFDAVNFDDPEVFKSTFAALTEPVQHLFAAHCCHGDVCNGGFNQFFFNSSGILAPEAEAGFRAIGMFAHADLVAQAMARFGPEYPRAEAARHEMLDDMFGEDQLFSNGPWIYRRVLEFHDLDTEYCRHNDEVDRCMQAYASKCVALGLAGPTPDAAYNIVYSFRETRGKPYWDVYEFGPPWNDGSDTAAICAMWQIEEMISNGAWPAVYYNRMGWMVPIAARGYRLIGLDGAAERCELAMKMVADAEAAHPGVDYTSEEWLSSRLMEHIHAMGPARGVESGWDLLDDGWAEMTEHTHVLAAAYITRMQQP